MKISWDYIISTFLPQQKKILAFPNNEVKQVLKIEEKKLNQKAQLINTLKQRFETNNKQIERNI